MRFSDNHVGRLMLAFSLRSIGTSKHTSGSHHKQHTSGFHLVHGMLLNMLNNHGLVPVLKFAAFHRTFPIGKLVVLEKTVPVGLEIIRLQLCFPHAALGPSEAGGVRREAGGAIEMPCCACMDRSCVRRSREVLLTLLVPALRLPY